MRRFGGTGWFRQSRCNAGAREVKSEGRTRGGGRSSGERSGLPKGRRQAGSAHRLGSGEEELRPCEKIGNPCHSERSEESAVVCFQEYKCRCFASLSMTAHFSTASPSAFAWVGKFGPRIRPLPSAARLLAHAVERF